MVVVEVLRAERSLDVRRPVTLSPLSDGSRRRHDLRMASWAERHGLHQRLAALYQELLIKQPEQPARAAAEYFAHRSEEVEEETAGAPSSEAEGPCMVILLGGPGTGCAAHGVAVAAALGMTRLSEDDLMQREVAHGSSLGNAITHHLKTGKIMPPDLVVELFENALAEGTGPWLLDGWPRRLDHLRALEKRLGRVRLVVGLRLAPEIAASRIAARDGECRGFFDEKQRLLGDAALGQRSKVFEHYAYSLRGEVASEGRLSDVDASGSLPRVGAQVVAAIRKVLGPEHTSTAPVYPEEEDGASVAETVAARVVAEATATALAGLGLQGLAATVPPATVVAEEAARVVSEATAAVLAELGVAQAAPPGPNSQPRAPPQAAGAPQAPVTVGLLRQRCPPAPGRHPATCSPPSCLLPRRS